MISDSWVFELFWSKHAKILFWSITQDQERFGIENAGQMLTL